MRHDVIFLKDIKGRVEGEGLRQFRKGERVAIDEKLAQQFINMGAIMYPEPEIEPVKPKNNASTKGRKSKAVEPSETK